METPGFSPGGGMRTCRVAVQGASVRRHGGMTCPGAVSLLGSWCADGVQVSGLPGPLNRRRCSNRTFGCVRLVWNQTLAWRHQRWLHRARRLRDVVAGRARSSPGWKTYRGVRLVERGVLGAVAAGSAAPSSGRSRTSSPAGPDTRGSSRGTAGRPRTTPASGVPLTATGELRLAKMDTPLEFVWSWRRGGPGVDRPVHGDGLPRPGRPLVRVASPSTSPTPEPEAAATGRGGRHRPGHQGLRGHLRRAEDRQSPGFWPREERNLARYQRRMARKVKGSNNRAKAKAKVARAHRKVRASRTDFLHRTSHQPGPRPRCDRDRRPGGEEHDPQPLAGQGHLRLRLGRLPPHARIQERQIRPASDRGDDRWFPSSKTCSGCGHLLAEL